VKLPDVSDKFIACARLRDKVGLLARVRYNRLIDVFLSVAAYSLQNHLRTTVRGLGQIETDELYVAVNNSGQQFVIPVQAKTGKRDRVGGVRVVQDLALCRKRFPRLIARPVAVQFLRDETGETIVMFELAESEGDIRVVEEKHYRLVPASEITPEDLKGIAPV
jgi:hypothetical protein